MTSLVRILLLDDHPAVTAGLSAVLAGAPDLEVVAAIGTEEELWPALHRTRPDVVVLDYHLPGTDSLALCRRVKADPTPPRVLVYSAYADASLAIPAAIAGADGMLSKGAPARELFEAIRRVSGGDRVFPPITPELRAAALAPLDDEERAIAAMALDETPPREIASTLGVDPPTAARRLDALLSKLEISHAADRA